MPQGSDKLPSISDVASFSAEYPVAIHVAPLHAVKGILARGAILAKSDLDPERQRITTRGIDEALGFRHFVHLYVPRRPSEWWSLPILAAQLGPSPVAPFPHVAISLATSSLADDECTLCLWNVAVSRPAVTGVCRGGNWTRGTAPHRIVEVWRRFAANKPSTAVSRGFWNEGSSVPTLRGDQIRDHLGLLRLAPRRTPELLLRGPIPLSRAINLSVFAAEDLECVRRLGPTIPVKLQRLEGYDSSHSQTAEWRRRIEEYFTADLPYPATLDFDRVRPK